MYTYFWYNIASHPDRMYVDLKPQSQVFSFLTNAITIILKAKQIFHFMLLRKLRVLKMKIGTADGTSIILGDFLLCARM